MTGHRKQGTMAGYHWHYDYRIFPVCEPCRRANAAYCAAYGAIRRDLRKLIALLAELLGQPAGERGRG